MIHTYAVIATHNKPKDLLACVKSLPDVEQIVVIDNASEIPVASYLDNATVVTDSEQPPNLSRIWNRGLDIVANDARYHGYSKWNVAVVNDDVTVPPGWAAALGTYLRQHPTALLAYPDQFGGNRRSVLTHTKAITTSAFDRIVGYAHMMKGESGLRYDERFRWWFGDDDLDWTARINGGSILVPGLAVKHKSANVSTNTRPELAAQADRDREAFISKWGSLPC